MSLLLALALAHLAPELPHPVADEFRDRVDALAREAVEEAGVPGVSIAAGRDGQLLLAKGWGYADAARGVPSTADTSYPIGSLTRQFTAVGILQLAEQGKLALDDDLVKWLPGFPTQGHAVQLRHLLANTSGLPGYAALAAAHGDALDRDLSRDELYALFEDLPFEFAPGTGYSSNNPSYLLLAMVLSQASGEEYGDYVRSHFLEPLGLDQTRFDAPGDRPAGFARGCRELSEERELEIPFGGPPGTSAPSLSSTVKDLFRWQCAIDDRLLIGEESTRAMTAPAELGDGLSSGHGFATAVGETDFSRVLSHTGGIGGFRVRLARYEDPGLTVVVLANCASAPVERLEEAVARLALDLLPAEIADLALDPQELARYAGTWQIATRRVRTFGRDGRLWFEDAGGDAFALLHQGRHVFVGSTDREMRVTFRVEGDGPAETFEILRAGVVSSGRRL